jgi:predicted amidohydrolase
VIVAVGQLHVGEGDVDINARGCRRALEDAAVAGAELLVLPECALTGYLFADRDAAEVAAIRACDPRIRELGDLAVQAGMTVVVGFLERAGDTLANSAAVLGSDGGVTLVRKTHLPVRAVENRVFVALADRAGSAADTTFLGASRVVAPDGTVLTPPLDDNCGHEVATATIDLDRARTKVTVFEPGEFEIDVFAHRRPDLYGSLSPDQEL